MKIRKKKKWLFLLIVLGVFVLLIGKNRTGQLPASALPEQVYAAELKGYLQIIPLSAEETERLILPKLNEVLTGADVRTVFEQTGLESCYAEAEALAGLSEELPLTRQQWTQVYELMIDKTGVREQLTEADIRYLGDVSGEDRIRADDGIYECASGSCRFEYGQTYTVYLMGNTILGRKDAPEDGAQQEPGQESGDSVQPQKEIPFAGVPDTVRVLLSQDNGQKPYREDVWVSGTAGLLLTSGENREEVSAGEVVSCAGRMDGWNADALTVQSADGGALRLTDASGEKTVPCPGVLYVYRGKGGYWAVSELGMEEYLCGVVPGEMPEKFADEAQKAQAVCARTYACVQIAAGGFVDFCADLDDTTACQVYLPASANERETAAVNATKGQVLLYGENLAEIYYFSTSCGYTSGKEVWRQEPVPYLTRLSLLSGERQTEFDDFLKARDVEAYDSHSRFFRWTAVTDPAGCSEAVRAVLQQHFDMQENRLDILSPEGAPLQDCSGLGACLSMETAQRSDSGMVTDLLLRFEGGSVHIYNENTIRSALGAAMTELTDQNGDPVPDMAMLPSAAFVAEEEEGGGYRIFGGGLGHGIGMSQYGADGMASAGLSYTEILTRFFPQTVLGGAGAP